jgi:ATP-dependent helicase/nuclease subunit A
MSAPDDPFRDATENQRIAADPQYSVFVTANAGSGKTKVLIDRIARLLLEGSKPSAFLCITFTKAAAAEMQSRLFERLGGWCVADDATLAKELAELPAPNADLGRARALFAQALETPGGLKIQTIHAFCERLLARFPIEAGVPPGFDIADEPRAAALLAEARAKAALDADAPLGAFRRFAARMSGDQLDLLLDRLALKRGEFRRYAARSLGPLFAQGALRDRHGASMSADEAKAAFVARTDWTTLRRAAEALASGSSTDQSCAELLREAANRAEAADMDGALEACFGFALTDKGTLRKTLCTKPTRTAHPWLDNALPAFAADCLMVREQLNAIERAEDAAAALALALKLDEAYDAAKGRAGALDFDDLIECARGLLQKSEAASWVLYKLDGGLDHILIDEGQDTSPEQWELIDPLQQEFFAGAGVRPRLRTVFTVGDPKQSIYSFQGADPERFLSEAQKLSQRAHAAERIFKAPGLRTSFRSAPEILRVVDQVVNAKELIGGPVAGEDVKHLASRAAHGGVVEVWPITPRPVAPEARPWDAPVDVQPGTSAPAKLAKAIALNVKAMIAAGEQVWDKETKTFRAMHAGDVMALVRVRGAIFRELIRALKREELPVAGADRMVLRDELVVEDCLALMRVALDPADDLALACVLKGPWCGLINDDRDIFPLAYGRAKGETLMSRLMASTEERYAAARAFVAELLSRRVESAFGFLSWALETPHGGGDTGWRRVFARLGPETRDPLEELLQRALKPGAHAAPTLQRFLHEIEVDAGQVKRELEAAAGSVRVMTVHGAKGLEAPVVILPDATAGVEDAPESGLIFDDENGPFLSPRKSDDDAALRQARAGHEARVEREHWRLLYVAMTRARDRLIVCGPQFGNSKEGEAPKSWRCAVETALDALGAEPAATPFGEGKRLGAPRYAAPAAAQLEQARTALPDWARKPAASARTLSQAAPSRIARIDPALFSPRGDGQKRFRRGRLIHGLLQRLPDVAPEKREAAARAWLARQGADESETESYAREALAVITDPRFAAVFAPASRAEAAIIGEVAGKAVSGVVDRLAVDDKRVIVLDFKTDRPAPADAAAAPDAYVLQLALYREVLRKIFPGRMIACALLWTEKPHLMEMPDDRLESVFATFARG